MQRNRATNPSQTAHRTGAQSTAAFKAIDLTAVYAGLTVPKALNRKLEQALKQRQISMNQLTTLLKVYTEVSQAPDGKFAELLVGMLTGSAEPGEVMTNDEYADAQAMGREVARNA